MPRRINANLRSKILAIANSSKETTTWAKYLEAKNSLEADGIDLKKSFFFNLLKNPQVEPPKRAKKMKTVVTEENVEKVYELMVIKYNGKASLRSIASEIGEDEISRTSVNTILKNELFLHPYKSIKVQILTDLNRHKRIEFCNQMLLLIENDPSYHHRIIFTDETMVQTENYPNRQNDRNWQMNQPYDFDEHAVWSNKAMALSGINYHFGSLPTYWFEQGGVNQHAYQIMLTDKVFHDLNTAFGHEYVRENFTWQQDGAPSHRTLETIEVIRTEFDHIISINGDIEWPPNSPDLNVCDYYLWGRAKSRSVLHMDIESAKSHFNDKMKDIKLEEIRKAIDDFPNRLRFCLGANGGHFLTH